MKKFLCFCALAVAMTLSFGSCKSADEQLEDAIAECNAECPSEIDDGIYILSYELDGRNVKFSVALDRESYGHQDLQTYTQAIGEEVEKAFVSGDDPDVEALVDACRATNRGIVVSVEWADLEDDECWEYRILPADLK